MSEESIRNVIAENEEFERLLPLIHNIAIIVYDGKDILLCESLIQYISDYCDKESVKRIVLLGGDNITIEKNANTLHKELPKTDITIGNIKWDSKNIKQLRIENTLTIHIANVHEININNYDTDEKPAIQLKRLLSSTRYAYTACFVPDSFNLFWCEDYSLRTQLNLRDLINTSKEKEFIVSNFCRERQAFINKCADLKILVSGDTFFQCMDEVEHGCEECCLCTNYKKDKHCPFAQEQIAKFYRQGFFVPQNDSIAHQWQMIAARQGYSPAEIQVANDLENGVGCEQDIKTAFDIYFKHAYWNEDKNCMKKIISMIESGEVSPITIIPIFVNLAAKGDEEATIALSDAFKNGDFEMPVDMAQQKSWIEEGAENGIPYCVKAMAEMYETHKIWKDAYVWYKKLDDIAPEMVTVDKIEEIEILMLTEGASLYEIAKQGYKYLHGYWGVKRDLHLALKCIKYASDHEIVFATGLLGQMYYNGIGVEKDVIKGVALLEEAADKRDLLSLDKISRIYESEKTNEMNNQWIPILKDEIEAGILNDKSVAYCLKARYLLFGYIYEKNERLAFSLMQVAANLDFPKAQYLLAIMYLTGTGVEKDEDLYNSWLKRSAENGYYKAQGRYGLKMCNGYYYFGNKETFEMLRSAYEQGYTDVCWYLSGAYINGWGIKNEKEGYKLIKIAAENGDAKAQEKLCEIYFRGNSYIEKSYKLCAEWGEKALKQGKDGITFEVAYSSAEIGLEERAKELYLKLADKNNGAAMNNYACLLTDEVLKTEWFRKAADAGDDYGYWNLGKQYKYGKGVEVNLEEAARLFIIAAEKGQKSAMLDLANMYKNGEGLEQNGEEAKKWYEQVLEAGETNALLYLGDLYIDGIAFPKDIDKSVHYYKIAAEKGLVRGFLELGKICEYEINDIHKSIYWYRKAAEKGSFEAKDNLKRLKSNWIEDNKVVNDN